MICEQALTVSRGTGRVAGSPCDGVGPYCGRSREGGLAMADAEPGRGSSKADRADGEQVRPAVT